MKALFVQHDHVSPTGPVAERLRHRGFEVDEMLVVDQDNFASPNVFVDFPDLEGYDLVVPMAPRGVRGTTRASATGLCQRWRGFGRRSSVTSRYLEFVSGVS